MGNHTQQLKLPDGRCVRVDIAGVHHLPSKDVEVVFAELGDLAPLVDDPAAEVDAVGGCPGDGGPVALGLVDELCGAPGLSVPELHEVQLWHLHGELSGPDQQVAGLRGHASHQVGRQRQLSEVVPDPVVAASVEELGRVGHV